MFKAKLDSTCSIALQTVRQIKCGISLTVTNLRIKKQCQILLCLLLLSRKPQPASRLTTTVKTFTQSRCPQPDVDCDLTKAHATDGSEELEHREESVAESPLQAAPESGGPFYSLELFPLSTCPEDFKDLFSYVQGEQHSTDWHVAEKLNLNGEKSGPSWTWWLCFYGLPHCPNLRVLDLFNCNFGDEGMKYLSQEGLQHCPLMTDLRLGGNNIRDQGMKHLSQEGLLHCPLLASLDLQFNNIGDEGMKHLSQEGLRNCPLLTELWLGCNDIGVEGIKHLLSQEGLQHCPLLTLLQLDENNIGDEVIKHLSQEGLRHCPLLVKLGLDNNDIGDEGMKHLSQEGLRHCPMLASLCLDGNNFGDEGIKHLSLEGLRHCPLLVELWLNDNNIVVEGIKHLSQEGLRHCPLLTLLGLSCNDIGDEGIKQLIQEGLRHCPLLVDLGLSNNNIGDDGMKHLSQQGLPYCKQLTSITLFGNRFSGAADREFCLYGIPCCPVLESLLGIDLGRFTAELGIPIEFRYKDNEEILTYLRQQRSDVSVEVSRVKVMLVGRGEVGKTTLAHKLLTDRFTAGQFTMTDGVEMHDWKHGSVGFQLWDFGGQEVYFNTHAMFFENRSVYLIMWNARQLSANEVLKKLDEYFQTVLNRAPDAPILLVSTHSDAVPAMSAECLAEVRAKYPTVLGYHHIDSDSGSGVDDLKAALVEVALQQANVTQSIPGKYVQVEERLKAMRSPDKFSISKAEYLEVVQAVQLDADQADLLLSLLHQWGAVHVLPGGGDIVLQPQQLADVMKCVVTATPAGEVIHGGVFHHKDLDTVRSTYSPHLRPQFLELLHHCELAYPLYDSAGELLSQLLVPAMLPSTLRTIDGMCQELYEDYGECACKYGKLEIHFSGRAMTFFPKLQARLRAMATRGGAWKQYYFVSLEDSITGEVSSALLCHEPSSGKIEIRYPLSSDPACGAALRAIQVLLDEQFKALNITDISLSAGSSVLKRAALLKRLQKDRNAVLNAEDDDGNPCAVSLAPLRMLFRELLGVPLAEDPPPLPPSLPSLMEGGSAAPSVPVPIILLSDLEMLLARLRQPSATRSDLADLCAHLLHSIPDVSHRCGVNRFHVRVFWLAMVDRGRDRAAEAEGRTYLVPISPGRSADDPWVAVHEARVECRGGGGGERGGGGGSGAGVPHLLDLQDTAFASLLLDALFEVGVPRGLQHLPGDCEWRGLVRMSAYEGALLDAQAAHFENTRTAEGAEVFMRKQAANNLMHSVAELQRTLAQRLDKISEVTDKIATVQMDGVYKMHDMPLLFSVTQPDATGITGWFQRKYARVFRVHFLCPVCAQPGGAGYKLARTKQEVAVLAKCIQYTLKAVEVISLFTPVPLPQLSDLGKYLPSSDTVAELGLTEVLEETQQRVSENLRRLDGKGPSSDQQDQQQQEVVMSLSDVHMLKFLLPLMGETFPPLSTGLQPVFFQGEHCAWVCKEPHRDAAGKVVLDCSKRFQEQGNVCLQIRVTK